MNIKSALFTLMLLAGSKSISAATKFADSSNYKSFITGLKAGDTLVLAKGTYTGDLQINGINGSSGNPIVIRGDKNGGTRFVARACCNTVSLAFCSYLVIEHLLMDGNHEFVDAVKAEGFTNNNVHHITLQYLKIINYDADQQSVGINTKCHAWNWIIRYNIIDGAGTGLYLGNSNGDNPFVNGLIEHNLVMNTIGYNMEIKHQWDTVRKKFSGTNVDGKTIIRYNVFSKEKNASTGANARPNVLIGALPGSGPGSTEVYEFYGNFLYENPVEALFQITGNAAIYNNLFVNHQNGGGQRTLIVTQQNGFQPRDIKIFHNTILSAATSGGIRLVSPNTSFKQYCYANAVFSINPIAGFTDSMDNITGTYASAGNYVTNASTNLTSLDLYPKNTSLKGNNTASTLFQNFTDYNQDFNGKTYDWTYRGAYSGSGTNPGWKLKMDTIPVFNNSTSGTKNIDNYGIKMYPNPANDNIIIETHSSNQNYCIINVTGKIIQKGELELGQNLVFLKNRIPGIYFVKIINQTTVIHCSKLKVE